MTVKTLTFIHNLLIEEEKRLITAGSMARDAYMKADEEDAENAAYLKERYESIVSALTAATTARADFELKEW